MTTTTQQPKPRTLKAARNHPIVDDAYIDSDGVWIDLVDGHQVDGVHGIHEDTVKEALARWDEIAPCNCEWCEKAEGGA